MEAHEPEFIQNHGWTELKIWRDYNKNEKKILRAQSDANRTAGFTLGFEPTVPLESDSWADNWAPVQEWIPLIFARMKITIKQGREVDEFWCEMRKFFGKMDPERRM